MRTLIPMMLAACLPNAYASSSELPGYGGRFAGDPKLTADEVALLDDAELRVLRNEVFAQYGRPFSSADLQAHFGKTSWYKADPGYDEGPLTANDKANVQLLQSLEGDRSAAQSKVGEYYGDGARLLLISDGGCEVVRGDDLYDWDTVPCKWKSRGQWVLTWTDGSWPKPGGEVFLRSLDDGPAKVKERIRVGRVQG